MDAGRFECFFDCGSKSNMECALPSRCEGVAGSLVRILATWSAVCLVVLFAGCAHVASLRVYPDDVPAASLRLAQVIAVATRAEVIQEKPYYEALLKSGIPDADIRDGSFAVGRIHCCGGTAQTRLSLFRPVCRSTPWILSRFGLDASRPRKAAEK